MLFLVIWKPVELLKSAWHIYLRKAKLDSVKIMNGNKETWSLTSRVTSNAYFFFTNPSTEGNKQAEYK